jgi:toxin FitB
MMLLDSNIVIYAAQAEHQRLRELIREHAPAVSCISYIEVLGYPSLRQQEIAFFSMFFDAAEILPLSNAIMLEAVKLRQKRRMTLGDSIIAATALVHRRTLVTHNISDFAWIELKRSCDNCSTPSV